MKIVNLLNSFGMGGTQKAAQVLAEYQEQDHDVVVWGLSGGPRKELLEEDGVSTKVFDSEDVLFDEVDGSGADVVHFHGDGFGADDLAKVSSDALICRTTNFGWFSEEEMDYLDYAFFPSKMSMFRYAKLFPDIFEEYREKFRLLYYPVEKEESDFDLREELGFSDDDIVIGKIGRSAEGKWSRLTVEAFSRFQEDFEDAKLVLVNPPEKITDVLEELGIESVTEVIDTVPPDQVSGFYEGIDVLAHTSNIGESFGYVIAESLIAGTPVVANSTPMRDNAQIELISNSENGFIANNAGSYADSMKKAANGDLDVYLSDHMKAEKVYSRYNSLVSDYGRQPEDDFSKERFSSEYRERLVDVELPACRFYSLEKNLWMIMSNSPFAKHAFYDFLQGLFIKKRKLNSLGSLVDDRF